MNGFERSKHQLNVGGVPQHRVEDLGADLMKLFDATGRAVKTYDTIGATSAKLQASEDARLYNENVASVKSALAYAEKDPSLYVGVKQRLDELSAEFVAKGEAFRDHKAAYEAYSEFALDITSNQKVAFEPVFSQGFLNSSKAKFSEDVTKAATASSAVPSSKELNIFKETGNTFGIPIENIEREYTSQNLAFIDESASGLSMDTVVEKFATTDGIIDYLNKMTGSIGMYKKDEESGDVSFISAIETPEVSELYMDKFTKLKSVVTKTKEYNPYYQAYTNNLIPQKIGTVENNTEQVKQYSDNLNVLLNSAGAKFLTPEQLGKIADDTSNATSFANKASKLKYALDSGTNPLTLEYLQGKSTVSNGIVIPTTGDLVKITTEDVSAFTTAIKDDVIKKMQRFEVTETDFEALSKAVKWTPNIHESVSKTLSEAAFKNKPTNLLEAKGLSNVYAMLGGTKSPLSPYIKKEYADMAQIMNVQLQKIDSMNLPEKEKEKKAQEVLGGFESLMISGANEILHKDTLSMKALEDLYDNVDINGLWNQGSFTMKNERDSVKAAREALTTDSNPNPSTESIVAFMSNNSYNTAKWFSREHGLDDTLLVAPKDMNGVVIPEKIFIEGTKLFLREKLKEMSFEKITIENGTMLGNNNSIVVRDKQSENILYVFSGQDYITNADKIKAYIDDSWVSNLFTTPAYEKAKKNLPKGKK